MFCPSSEAQEELMVDTYTKAGIDPLKLTYILLYIEAHITGTKGILISLQLDSMDDKTNEYLNTYNDFYLIPNSK
ncbi:unnamed protein product, partial [Medioppia subpectinata]